MRAKKISNINVKALLDYGFIKNDNIYTYETNILNNKFKVLVNISDKLESKIIDNLTNEEYILVDIDTATGNYVGKIREEYENILSDIINNCTSNNKYESKQTYEIINYVKNTYHDSLEYLWKNNDKTGVARNKNNNKWYLVVMIIKAFKLGLESDEEIEIIDIRYQKDKVEEIIDNKSIFPAWHMNKRSWVTIILNSELNSEIIYSLIDNSYELSQNK